MLSRQRHFVVESNSPLIVHDFGAEARQIWFSWLQVSTFLVSCVVWGWLLLFVFLSWPRVVHALCSILPLALIFDYWFVILLVPVELSIDVVCGHPELVLWLSSCVFMALTSVESPFLSICLSGNFTDSDLVLYVVCETCWVNSCHMYSVCVCLWSESAGEFLVPLLWDQISNGLVTLVQVTACLAELRVAWYLMNLSL